MTWEDVQCSIVDGGGMSIAGRVQRGKVSACTPWSIEPQLKATNKNYSWQRGWKSVKHDIPVI